MTDKDEKFERIAQRHIADLKKSSKAIVEDAAVRAVHKVAAEFDAKSDHRLMEPVAYDKTEMNCFAQDLYDQKIREGKHGHYESMFHVIHQCIKKVSPPQRTWVGLTEEDYAGIPLHWIGLAEWVEAKLREKNA